MDTAVYMEGASRKERHDVDEGQAGGGEEEKGRDEQSTAVHGVDS
jgi:hypothetical protein